MILPLCLEYTLDVSYDAIIESEDINKGSWIEIMSVH